MARFVLMSETSPFSPGDFSYKGSRLHKISFLYAIYTGIICPSEILRQSPENREIAYLTQVNETLSPLLIYAGR